MEIRKVKKTKADRLNVSYKKEPVDGKGGATVDESGDSKFHPDMEQALNAFGVHLGILTGYIKSSDVKDPALYGKEVDSFHVSGYSIGGEDDDQGIVITGYRIVPGSGKAVILNAPFTRFNEDDKTRYKFMDQLITLVENARDEATKYLGGKFAPEPQQTIDFDAAKEKVDEATK